ncbi:hypothetical protein [Mesorhizobium sp.]|uniref:hypothetical protein n=1 Tax=Mesorhizobium sp. TaxID=1871066 RepID=UPI00257EFE63|nr:hypothetical protein [Mesorhizobium sp.]
MQAVPSKNDLAAQGVQAWGVPPVVSRTVTDEPLSKRFQQAAAESALMGSSAGDARHGHGLAYPR